MWLEIRDKGCEVPGSTHWQGIVVGDCHPLSEQMLEEMLKSPEIVCSMKAFLGLGPQRRGIRGSR